MQCTEERRLFMAEVRKSCIIHYVQYITLHGTEDSAIGSFLRLEVLIGTVIQLKCSEKDTQATTFEDVRLVSLQRLLPDTISKWLNRGIDEWRHSVQNCD